MICIDGETKSFADLKKVGAWAYFEHVTTEIICLCWGIDDAPIQEWWPGKNETDDMPADLEKAILEDQEVEAHHVAFEKSMWILILAAKFGWILPNDSQFRDSMATACYYGLPAGLDKLARVLSFQPKDPEGNRLITKYSKPYFFKS